MGIRRRQRDPKVAWLAAHPWWGEMTEDEVQRLAALGERLDLPPGRLLMHRGQQGIEAALIIEGEVVVMRDGTVVAWLGPGEIVGELAVLDDAPRNADVRTSSDVQLLILDGTALKTVLAEFEHLRQRVLELAERHRGPSTPGTPADVG